MGHQTSNQSPCSAWAEAEAGLPGHQGAEGEEGEEDHQVHQEASAGEEVVGRRDRRGEAALCCWSGAEEAVPGVRSMMAEAGVLAVRLKTAEEEAEEAQSLQAEEGLDGMRMAGEEAAGLYPGVPWAAEEVAAQGQQVLLLPVEAALAAQSRDWEAGEARGFLHL